MGIDENLSFLDSFSSFDSLFLFLFAGINIPTSCFKYMLFIFLRLMIFFKYHILT